MAIFLFTGYLIAVLTFFIYLSLKGFFGKKVRSFTEATIDSMWIFPQATIYLVKAIYNAILFIFSIFSF